MEGLDLLLAIASQTAILAFFFGNAKTKMERLVIDVHEIRNIAEGIPVITTKLDYLSDKVDKIDQRVTRLERSPAAKFSHHVRSDFDS